MTAPAPLFRDPVHDGAADPTVIHDGTRWWMFYTQRRPADPGPGVRWVHGSDIGVACSEDGGRSWRYRGTVQGLDVDPGRNTLWAPEVVLVDGTFHMYVSYIRGVPDRWAGHDRQIVHCTSPDLERWTVHGPLTLSSRQVIDACVHPLPGGHGHRMWFKDEAHGSSTWAADSTDLHRWDVRGPVLEHRPHEGPNVFALGGWYWMIVDVWEGQDVFRSPDLTSWTPAGRILASPSSRPDDAGPGLHADVVTRGEQAWIFYFTHPGRVPMQGTTAPDERRSSVQVAHLTVRGRTLVCERQTVPALEEER